MLKDLLNLPIKTSDPETKYLTSGVDWQGYNSLINSLSNNSSYRVAYLSGTLEIMSPSRSHEIDKENLGRLLEAYLEINRIRFWGLGSTTLRREEQQAGKEPDKCYCLETDKEVPDLAIEVIYTSGGVNTLEIYRRLGVREVWFWQKQELKIYCLQNGNYQPQSQSQLLPNLDLALLTQHLLMKDPLEAVISWRKKIQAD
ncbi:MAG: Uma2 family endonuclease [Cyanobacteria bacterium J06621_8]